MKTILLTRGKFALVDDEDYERISKHKWHAQLIGGNWYAKRHYWLKNEKRYTTDYMHRIIMCARDSHVIDHKDHDTLNNQKYNLRMCTKWQNNMNTSKSKGRSSKYKGVCYFKSRNKFIAYVGKGKNRKYLGYHKTEEAAAMAYNKEAIKVYGEFANLNVIQ